MGDHDERLRAHRAANSALRARIDAISARLDAVGVTIADDDPAAVQVATTVAADLEQLRAEAEDVRSRRDYVTYVPGGGYTNDDAIDLLEGAICRANNTIGSYEHRRRVRQAKAVRDKAAHDLVAVWARVDAIKREAERVGADYRPTDDTAAGLQTRLRGFELMADLADALDELHTLQHQAGQIGHHRLASMLANNDQMRTTAREGLTHPYAGCRDPLIITHGHRG